MLILPMGPLLLEFLKNNSRANGFLYLSHGASRRLAFAL